MDYYAVAIAFIAWAGGMLVGAISMCYQARILQLGIFITPGKKKLAHEMGRAAIRMRCGAIALVAAGVMFIVAHFLWELPR